MQSYIICVYKQIITLIVNKQMLHRTLSKCLCSCGITGRQQPHTHGNSKLALVNNFLSNEVAIFFFRKKAK